MTLTLSPLSGIPLIYPGDNIAEIIFETTRQNGLSLLDGDIFVLAQKIVSKAEGRFVNLKYVQPSLRARELAQLTGKDPRFVELVLRESREVLRVRMGTIIVEHHLGFVCANAGIDQSNVGRALAKQNTSADEWVLLLPQDPDASAQAIRCWLEQMCGVRLGVLIIDSHGRAWRLGIVGVAIGIAGLPALVDMRGRGDLFDYKLRITQIGAADELAAAASLVMGQAAEGTPVVHVRGFPYHLRESSLRELIRPKADDLFR